MAGVIGVELKERIRDANDIVEVINSYVPLKRAGANFLALCPFHLEKTPSFNVNPAKQIFHCFGCHKGGDVFAFVREYENLSFPEAARRLAERARIPIEWERNPREHEQGRIKERLYKVHEELAGRWHRLLLNDARGREGREYLKSRGFGGEAAAQFRLGFAPDEWDGVLRWAAGRGYGAGLLEQAGLVSRKEGSERRYDRFRRRLMFPITDIQGRVVGFSGRVIGSEEKGGKYINSPETLIFKKSKVLFGLDKARQAALEAKAMIVCEGQLDLIACHVNGIQNVVAPQGTALTAEHARILKSYVSEIILCFDSDSAGQNAARRAFDDLLQSGLAVRAAQLPASCDPDSFIRERGAAEFRERIDQAPGFFDYLLDHLCREHDGKSDRGRNAIVGGMGVAVNRTGNAVVIDTYAQKTSLRLGVQVGAIRSEFAKAVSRAGKGLAVADEPPLLDRPATPEFWLLKLVIGDIEPSLAEWLFQHLDIEWVQHRAVKQALVFRLDHLAENRPFEISKLLGEIDHAAAGLITEAALAPPREIPNPQKQLADIVLRLRNLHIERQVLEIDHQLGGGSPGEAEQTALLETLQALHTTKRQPLSPLADA